MDQDYSFAIIKSGAVARMKVVPFFGLMSLIGCFLVLNFAVPDASAKLVINEINYSIKKEAGIEDSDKEWIEIFNSGTEGVRLGGWRLSAGVDYDFPNAILGAGDYLIVAADPEKFSVLYPDSPKPLGPWVG